MATNAEIKAFINLFGTLAVNECNRRIAAGQGFILPSVCLAQSALETDWGVAGIMKRANAFFGIKAGGSWTGKVYTADTWEVKDGVAYNTVANFRAYDSPEESLRDYYALTVGASRYSKAVSYGSDPSKWLSAKETITAIHAGGYATDSLYVQKIMNTINGRDLTSIDTKIDGVSVMPGYGGDQSFNTFVKGALEYADSGRTIALNNTVAGAYATDWENAPSITGKYTFTINDPEGAITDISIAKITGETVLISQIENGDTITGPVDKVGFSFTVADWVVSDVDLENVMITLVSDAPMGEGAEITKSVLAYFVEIE